MSARSAVKPPGEASATRALVTWIVDTRRPAPSAPEVERAKLSIVDAIACGLAATSEAGSRALKNSRITGETLQASVWGMGCAATPQDAALINGFLAHLLDFDDSEMVARAHPSCVIVPAILAMAEPRGCAGEEIIDAYLTGYYVFQLLGRVSAQAMAARGYHVTGMIGALAATAALSRLLRLSADQTATAFGIAATTAAGLRASFGSDMKAYHAGRGAASAIDAVELALAGMSACQDVVETTNGFVWVLADPARVQDVTVEVKRLVSGEYSIVREPPNIKLFACCHGIHPNIEAVLLMREKLIGRLDSIREIVAEGPHTRAMYLPYSRPETGLQGKFSMEGGVAVALLDGCAGVEQFSDESFQRAEVQALLRKVRFTTTDRLEELFLAFNMPGNVTVVTDQGVLREEILDPKGCRTNPCSFADVADKFQDCARGALAPEEISSIIATLADFEKLNNVSSILHRMRGFPR